jgi:hypothetical protein
MNKTALAHIQQRLEKYALAKSPADKDVSLRRLIAYANYLDSAGLKKEADLIDLLIKEAGIMSWLSGGVAGLFADGDWLEKLLTGYFTKAAIDIIPEIAKDIRDALRNDGEITMEELWDIFKKDLLGQAELAGVLMTINKFVSVGKDEAPKTAPSTQSTPNADEQHSNKMKEMMDMVPGLAKYL